ncbi:unnamed protein product [Prorocentrum cordatum]|uniref:Uncharacterized protein n=1 Tax=Prorocentrum cordatum TaxID=2364126 RepID=A0ABN9VJD3_9DINO|nr:unnamed protein product [Polarella glacialis]
MWLWSCAGGECAEQGGGEFGELQINLSSDGGTEQKRPPAAYKEESMLMRGDSFDITFTPRTFAIGGEDTSVWSSHGVPATPRRRAGAEGLDLPILREYRVPPNCNKEDPVEVQRAALLHMYQAFAVDLHAGMYLTQLTSSREHSEIHVQLMDDLVTLKMDQSNGHILEFPLDKVLKVYRITHDARGAGLDDQAAHIVVLEFMRRKLAFVFPEEKVTQRFLISLELLIQRAKQHAKVQRPALTPALPQGPQQSVHTWPADALVAQCPSPSPRGGWRVRNSVISQHRCPGC